MFKHKGRMKCPSGCGLYLNPHKVIASGDGREIELDRCARCEGVWYDVGELHQLVEVADEKVKVPRGAEDAHTPCPRCDGKLMLFYYPQTYAMIEACKRCGGIWIGKNELREIYMVRQHIREHQLHPDLHDMIEALYEAMEEK
jgi:Zn-finger nucleic acid-binding protein